MTTKDSSFRSCIYKFMYKLFTVLYVFISVTHRLSYSLYSSNLKLFLGALVPVIQPNPEEHRILIHLYILWTLISKLFYNLSL